MVWCSFFSNDFEYVVFGCLVLLIKGIWMMDCVGVVGYNLGCMGVDFDGFYMDDFGGILSVCFGVVGVVVLMFV